uniref:Uncharacterized protein n=1 Tax=Arundo donax TaxID=35708 RepID=A0A0A8Y594_ARUDO
MPARLTILPRKDLPCFPSRFITSCARCNWQAPSSSRYLRPSRAVSPLL